MNPNLLNLILLSLSFLLLFGISELINIVFKIHVEYTRKLVHICSGLLVLTFPFLFTHYIWVIIISVEFFILLKLSLKFNFLKSINGISRQSYGSLVYPLVVVISFLFYHLKNTGNEYFYFYLPMLIMAFADPAAAFFGKKIPFGRFKVGAEEKTISGAIGFFVVAFIINLFILPETNFLLLFFIPFAATIAESRTSKGLDNLTVPLTIITILLLFPIK